MNKERIGRLILTATSPDTNVRLTHEEGVELGNACCQLLEKAAAFDKLRECMGYVQNSSEQTVMLFQDDATRDYFVQCVVGKKSETYFGDTLFAAIDKAHLKEKQE